MPSDHRQLRLTVLTEDKRTERFFRKLLASLGVQRCRFETAPTGRGSGEAWVAKRYPDRVKVLRSKNYQRSLRLLAVRDDDGVGLTQRKQQLDNALKSAGLLPRAVGERIATPVPARNIETWLLTLLGYLNLDEARDYKATFERTHAARESDALRSAANAWGQIGDASPASLKDGRCELDRILT